MPVRPPPPSPFSARNRGKLRAKKGPGQLLRQLAEQPGPAERPEAVGGAAADAQGLGRFLMRQAGEVAQLHEPGRVGVVAFQPAQHLVQRDEVVGTGLGGGEVRGEIDAQPSAAVLVGLLATGLLDEDASHGLGGGGEDVAAAIPVLGQVYIDQAQVRFMHQGGGL